MSETLFRFLASELTRLRVVCKFQDCGAVVEFSLAQLAGNGDAIKCPVCQNALQKAAPNHHLARLAEMLLKLSAVDYMNVEFTLPDA
jgi:hypothetical protein